MEGQFHQNRLNWTAYDTAILARGGILNGMLGKGEGGQKTNVKIFAHLQVRYDAEVKTRSRHGFSAGKGVVSDKILGVVNAVIARVIAECDAEIVVFLLKIEVIQVFTLIKLRRNIQLQKAKSQQQEARTYRPFGVNAAWRGSNHFVAV